MVKRDSYATTGYTRQEPTEIERLLHDANSLAQRVRRIAEREIIDRYHAEIDDRVKDITREMVQTLCLG